MSQVLLRIALSNALEELESLEDADADVIARCRRVLDDNGGEVLCLTSEKLRQPRKSNNISRFRAFSP